jgi:hypothetical protein
VTILLIGVLIVITGIILKLAFKVASCLMRIVVFFGIVLMITGLFIWIFRTI